MHYYRPAKRHIAKKQGRQLTQKVEESKMSLLVCPFKKDRYKEYVLFK